LIDEVSNLKWKMLCTTYQLGSKKGKPYVISCSEKLEKNESDQMHKGITATAGGFTDHKDVIAFEYSR
jgi:uridine phosphorylase